MPASTRTTRRRSGSSAKTRSTSVRSWQRERTASSSRCSNTVRCLLFPELEVSEEKCSDLRAELKLVNVEPMEKIKQGAAKMDVDELHDAILMRTLSVRLNCAEHV